MVDVEEQYLPSSQSQAEDSDSDDGEEVEAQDDWVLRETMERRLQGFLQANPSLQVITSFNE